MRSRERIDPIIPSKKIGFIIGSAVISSSILENIIKYKNHGYHESHDMATTIQISDDVQKRLFSFINKKEKELGHRISYNDAIILLLECQPVEIDKDGFIKHVEQYQGILDIKDAKKARQTERDLERERERHLQH